MYGAIQADEVRPSSARQASTRSLVAATLAICVTTLVCVVYLVTEAQTILHELRLVTVPTSSLHAVAPPGAALTPRTSLSRDFGAQTNGTRVLIVHAGDDWLAQFGQEVARGAASVTTAVRVLHPANASISDVLWADAVILGSNVYNANVDPELMAWINGWPTTHDLSAKELVLLNLLHSLMIFRFVVVGGDAWTSAFGASAIMGEGPFHLGTNDSSHRPGAWPSICYRHDNHIPAYFLLKAHGLGQRVANVATKLRAPRDA
ncbi:hypothetical protein SPRG_03653 [Saprolegnia parasitica CBS 223.65]|uniref:NADPH-dependent FMN reductase-like domain-containing protein n=1 Tax=Saprolegnia parasitica (strain CBS 223.65) TaxID=695850 RepID=A0A067CMM7_SAPPC|nr:hypothetical protein SPRG_03653 [Saprolegnia parasitica CBS 223.65]KDO31733.1 hypothetical protein SPRG_03653 [Saprolegnia parasitica CBS 223.65]|eukprot:XP_012197614.1 hypothetical protein SPRG_03653 [Saprolegnia parasitica CBS 223.65]